MTSNDLEDITKSPSKSKKKKIISILFWILFVYLVIVFFVNAYNNIKWANNGTLVDRYSGYDDKEIQYRKFLADIDKQKAENDK